MFGMATIAVGCCHVSGLLVQSLFDGCWPWCGSRGGSWSRAWARHPWPKEGFPASTTHQQ